jgi:hypothetical protein
VLVWTVVSVHLQLLHPKNQNTYSKEDPLQHLALLIAAALKLELPFLIVLLYKVQQDRRTLEDRESIRLGSSGMGAVNENRDTSVWVHCNEPGFFLDVRGQVNLLDAANVYEQRPGGTTKDLLVVDVPVGCFELFKHNGHFVAIGGSCSVEN